MIGYFFVYLFLSVSGSWSSAPISDEEFEQKLNKLIESVDTRLNSGPAVGKNSWSISTSVLGMSRSFARDLGQVIRDLESKQSSDVSLVGVLDLLKRKDYYVHRALSYYIQFDFLLQLLVILRQRFPDNRDLARSLTMANTARDVFLKLGNVEFRRGFSFRSLPPVKLSPEALDKVLFIFADAIYSVMISENFNKDEAIAKLKALSIPQECQLNDAVKKGRRIKCFEYVAAVLDHFGKSV